MGNLRRTRSSTRALHMSAICTPTCQAEPPSGRSGTWISTVEFGKRLGSKNRASMHAFCRTGSTRASGYTIRRSPFRSGKPSSMSHKRPELQPTSSHVALASNLAHRAVAGLFGEGETRHRLYARRLPQDFVDRWYRIFRADGVLYRDVEVSEEARVDLAVRR